MSDKEARLMPGMPVAPMETPEEIEQRKKQELLSKVRQMRQGVIQNHGQIKPRDPAGSVPRDKHYAWINVHPLRVTHYKALGYEICKDERITTDFEKADGTHVFGDLILMYCNKDYYEALKLDAAIRAVEGVEGEEIFKTFAEKSNVKTFVPSS